MAEIIPGQDPETAEEDGSSSGSTTPNSTSTYEYSQEPYESFQDKVLSLARAIGGCEEVVLERQRGGSYNRVVIAELTKGEKNVRGIFRIPRYTDVTGDPDGEQGGESGEKPRVDTEVLDQAALLQYLASHGMSAPALLAYDASAENALRSPYVFQECSKGTPLDKVYGTMSLGEKLYVVGELVRTLVSAEGITFPQSGVAIAGRREDMPEAASNLFGEEGPTLALEIKPFANIPTKSLADLLSHKLRGHCEEERSFDPDNPVTKMWERLCCIHEEMKTAEIFNLRIDSATASEKRILYHWDLEPRNILVNRTPDGAGWLIDMVIDWDRVQAVPSVLARKPPVWLWDFSDDTGRASIASDYDGDIDLLEPTRYDNDSGRLSADNQHIRRHFEDRFVSELANVYPGYDQEAYVQESYGHGRWIRRLARFAIHGASDNQDLTRFEHLDSDWSAFLADKSKSRKVAEA